MGKGNWVWIFWLGIIDISNRAKISDSIDKGDRGN